MKQWVVHKPMSGTNVLEDWTSVEDSEHSGRRATSESEESNQRVLRVIHSSCHMTIHEVMRFSLKI